MTVLSIRTRWPVWKLSEQKSRTYLLRNLAGCRPSVWRLRRPCFSDCDREHVTPPCYFRRLGRIAYPLAAVCLATTLPEPTVPTGTTGGVRAFTEWSRYRQPSVTTPLESARANSRLTRSRTFFPPDKLRLVPILTTVIYQALERLNNSSSPPTWALHSLSVQHEASPG